MKRDSITSAQDTTRALKEGSSALTNLLLVKTSLTRNLYSYISNNPLSRSDEDGNRWFYKTGKDGTEVQWVNPNEDGTYTSPGEGWKEFVPSKENGFHLIFYSADGYHAYYFGEKKDGSPDARSLWTGKVENKPDHILAAAFIFQDIFNLARASFTAWQAAGIAAKQEIRTVATQAGATTAEQQIVKAAAGKITGFTKHGINQAISRDGVGVATRAIADARCHEVYRAGCHGCA